MGDELNFNGWGSNILNGVIPPPVAPPVTDFGINTDSFGLNQIALGETRQAGLNNNFLGNADPGTGSGFDWGTLQGWGQALGGIGELGQAYMAYKNYGLAKDQFNFSKDFANRNLANQASTVNAASQQRAAARNTFAGGSANKAARVDGSPISDRK